MRTCFFRLMAAILDFKTDAKLGFGGQYKNTFLQIIFQLIFTYNNTFSKLSYLSMILKSRILKHLLLQYIKQAGQRTLNLPLGAPVQKWGTSLHGPQVTEVGSLCFPFNAKISKIEQNIVFFGLNQSNINIFEFQLQNN